MTLHDNILTTSILLYSYSFLCCLIKWEIIETYGGCRISMSRIAKKGTCLQMLWFLRLMHKNNLCIRPAVFTQISSASKLEENFLLWNNLWSIHYLLLWQWILPFWTQVHRDPYDVFQSCHHTNHSGTEYKQIERNKREKVIVMLCLNE